MEGRKFLQNPWKQHGKEEAPVGVGAAVEAQPCCSFPPPQLAVPRFSPISPRWAPEERKPYSLSQLLCLGFLVLLLAFGSFLFSIPSRLSVTFPPLSRPSPKWAARIPAVAHLHSASSPAGPAPPSRTSAASGRAACGAGAAPPRPPRLRGYAIVIAIFFLPRPSPCPSAARRSLAAALGTEGRGRDEATAGAAGLCAERRCCAPAALGGEMPLEDGGAARRSGRHPCGVTGCEGTRDAPHRAEPAPRVSGAEEMVEDEELWPERDDGDVTFGRGEEVCGALQRAGSGEALMAELSERVQEVVRSSGWWERHGVDICILSCSLLALPAGKNPPPPMGVPLLSCCFHVGDAESKGVCLCWKPISSLSSCKTAVNPLPGAGAS